MVAHDLRKLLKAQPFTPIRLGLSDGRSVLIHHPDQVVVSDRHVYVGLAQLERSAPLATPRRPDALPRDWLWISILHIATVESQERARHGRRSRAIRRRRSS